MDKQLTDVFKINDGDEMNEYLHWQNLRCRLARDLDKWFVKILSFQPVSPQKFAVKTLCENERMILQRFESDTNERYGGRTTTAEEVSRFQCLFPNPS